VPAGNAYYIVGKDLVSQTNEGLKVRGAASIDVSTAKTLFDRGVSFVDVRGVRHWSKGYIPGAVHLVGYSGDHRFFSELELSKIVSKDQ
jgi:hypothetical protein